MTVRDDAAIAFAYEDTVDLERENRELASKQVRKINDTLRRVRSISKQLPDIRTTEPAPPPAQALVREEVVAPRRTDPRREREDNTDRILIPEPSLAPSVSEMLQKAFDLFEQECHKYPLTKTKASPVVRSWKLS